MDTNIQENWRPVKGYEGIYEISDFGRVKRLPLNVKYSSGIIVFTKGGVMKNTLGNHGYLYVTFSKGDKRKVGLIHRLVCEAFLTNDRNVGYVNHKNGVKIDNRLENLEWCTCSENHLHAFKIGLRTNRDMRKGKHPRAKKIIDNETGVVYDCITSAAEDLGVIRRTLSKRITRGSKRFVYYVDNTNI